MNKKGFTLVELLAVIIILALLALLASTAVTKLVKDSKDDLYNNQLLLIEKAAEAWGADNINLLPDVGSCKYLTLSDLQEYGLLDSNITNPRTNEPVENINIKISEATGKHGNLIVDYEVNPESIDGCSRIYYSDGAVVYFDVKEGEVCSKTTYELSWDEDLQDYLNSSTGYNGINPLIDNDNNGKDDKGRNSCLKFYAFNSYNGNTVNLLLDHNTTASAFWNSSGSNASGPSTKSNQDELLGKLYESTSSWEGTIIPKNYEYRHDTADRQYEVDYSEYKARIITMQEIAKITGVDKKLNWDETQTTSIWYYFDSSCSGLTGCKYGWLYDRTNELCTSYGCLNNSDEETYGYWTISAIAGAANTAWRVYYQGYVNGVDVDDWKHFGFVGVRPVIEVNKSSLE